MAERPIAIASIGLVTSVGLNAPATCAAIRAGISNASETRFIDAERRVGHGARRLIGGRVACP